MLAIQQELAALQQALEINPNDGRVLTRLGNLYYDAGMFQKAIDLYKRSLENAPGDPNVSTDLGVCYWRVGQPDEAIKQFRASIGIKPDHWQSWLNLGVVSLHAKQDVETAKEAFDKIEELNPSFEGLPQLRQDLERVRSGGKL